ncbi:MAG: hypothetical protein LBC42_02050 [Puniceicoccales bacterium]|nr:hypothetical protein [Puniceicoccales bacterium]
MVVIAENPAIPTVVSVVRDGAASVTFGAPLEENTDWENSFCVVPNNPTEMIPSVQEVAIGQINPAVETGVANDGLGLPAPVVVPPPDDASNERNQGGGIIATTVDAETGEIVPREQVATPPPAPTGEAPTGEAANDRDAGPAIAADGTVDDGRRMASTGPAVMADDLRTHDTIEEWRAAAEDVRALDWVVNVLTTFIEELPIHDPDRVDHFREFVNAIRDTYVAMQGDDFGFGAREHVMDGLEHGLVEALAAMERAIDAVQGDDAAAVAAKERLIDSFERAITYLQVARDEGEKPEGKKSVARLNALLAGLLALLLQKDKMLKDFMWMGGQAFFPDVPSVNMTAQRPPPRLMNMLEKYMRTQREKELREAAQGLFQQKNLNPQCREVMAMIDRMEERRKLLMAKKGKKTATPHPDDETAKPQAPPRRTQLRAQKSSGGPREKPPMPDTIPIPRARPAVPSSSSPAGNTAAKPAPRADLPGVNDSRLPRAEVVREKRRQSGAVDRSV